MRRHVKVDELGIVAEEGSPGRHDELRPHVALGGRQHAGAGGLGRDDIGRGEQRGVHLAGQKRRPGGRDVHLHEVHVLHAETGLGERRREELVEDRALGAGHLPALEIGYRLYRRILHDYGEEPGRPAEARDDPQLVSARRGEEDRGRIDDAGYVQRACGHGLGLLGPRVYLEELHRHAAAGEGLLEHAALDGDDEREIEGRLRDGDADLLGRDSGGGGGERRGGGENGDDQADQAIHAESSSRALLHSSSSFRPSSPSVDTREST